MDFAIRAERLQKRFGDKTAVGGVDMTVRPGEIHGFLGQNGAGKTTTIRMLLGILTPDDGVAEILGSDNPLSIASRVGYLPEERGLYPAMTTRETIAFMGALRGLPLAEGRKRADVLLSAYGLEGETTAKIRTMSKGMAQKVQLLGSFVHEPELIILDEPFSGLDPVNQQALEDIIAEQRRRGATILFSTHIMSHAERLCDRLTIVAGGRTRFAGTVRQARDILPAQVHLRADTSPDAVLADVRDVVRLPDGSLRFPLPEGGVEQLLQRLAGAGLGVREFSVERPTLHDAFVAMVGDPDADEVRADPAGEGEAKPPLATEAPA